MESILLISVLISFILTLITIPRWIKKCKQVDLLWEDMNKYGHPKNVAAAGGITVVTAFTLSLFFYVAIRTFIIQDTDGISLQIFASLTVILMLAIMGLTDELLRWKHSGLSASFRIILAALTAIPLVVINTGQTIMSLPFIGPVNFGLFYTFVLIPLGIAGATTTYNILAGFNGLEAGQGIIIISFLSFIAYITGTPWLALMGLCMVASLLAFYFYNKFPAKVFPGDILTYSLGALIAIMAIIGDFEKIAIFVFSPYILEAILKLRGRLKKQSFGIPDKDNNIEMPYNGKIYSTTHLSIYLLSKFKRNVKEKDVVYFIFAVQIAICLLALLIFKSFIF